MNRNEQKEDSGIFASSRAERASVGMKEQLSVLVAGRTENTVREIATRLAEDRSLSIASRINTNGHSDPLHSVESSPDILIVVLSGGWEDELKSLIKRPATDRPPSIIVSLEDNPKAMRLAMRAGAREFLHWPEELGAMRSALSLIASEHELNEKSERGKMITVINAKGGSGASFIASSLAHILASNNERRAALLDLDLQFANIGSYFDLKIRHDLMEVIEAVPDMDEVALKGYMTPHESGLAILGSQGISIGLSEEISAERFRSLLELLGATYERLVIDAPRHLDYLTVQALEGADNIIIVLQQNIASLRDAIRLLAILRNELSIPKSRITIAINRYNKNAEISESDVRNALSIEKVFTVNNDYSLINESLNSGLPLFQTARNAKVTRCLISLADDIDGVAKEQSTNIVKSVLTGLRTFLNSDRQR